MMKKIGAVFIIFTAMVLMTCIWPLGLIMKETESKSTATDYFETGAIQNEILFEQEFVPKYSFLKSISLQISRAATFGHGNEGELIFAVYDDQDTLLVSQQEKVSNIKDRQYYEFSVNQKLEKGGSYRYQLKGINCETPGPRVRFGDIEKIGLQENKRILYGGRASDDISTVALYQYDVPLGLDDILVFDTWIVTIAALCYTILKLSENKEVSN